MDAMYNRFFNRIPRISMGSKSFTIVSSQLAAPGLAAVSSSPFLGAGFGFVADVLRKPPGLVELEAWRMCMESSRSCPAPLTPWGQAGSVPHRKALLAGARRAESWSVAVF
jgi:hypothetical protein